MRLRALVVRVRALFGRDRLDRELAAELESHLAHHIDDNIRAGMPADEARRQALVKLGGLAQAEARYRERRGIPFVEHLASDVRYAARALAAMPGFTIVAIVTLGLGIGANAAIFSVIDAVLLRSLPVDRPERLVTVGRTGGELPIHSYPDYRDIRDRNTVLAGLAALRFSPVNLQTARGAARVWGTLASGNYFDVLGVRASAGRALAPSDDITPGGHPVAVVSDDAWRTRFAADPAIVGSVVKINGMAFTIVGIMPRGFRGTERLFAPEIWIPMAMQAHVESGNDWLERRQTHNIFLLGRLRDGIGTAEATASLNVLAEALGREHPQLNEGMRLSVAPPGLVGNTLRGPFVGFSGALIGVAGLVLLLTCTNLTGVLLARSTDRRRDTAIRIALGASRGALVRRSLVESALLAAGGAAAALLLARGFAIALSRWRIPVDIPITPDVSVDYRVLLFALGLAAAAAAFTGLMPVTQETRIDVVPALKEDTIRCGGRWHLRDAIIALQIAMSTVLLIGSLLVTRSLQHASQVDVGFNPDGAVMAQVDLGLERYSQTRARDFQREIVERLSTQPGVESAAVANALPLSIDVSTHSVYVEGKPQPRGTSVPSTIYYQVSPGFFRTFQMRLITGRDFDASDLRDRPRVAIVNQAFAARLLGTGDAVGKRFRSGPNGAWTEVIGVVQDGKYQTLAEEPTPVAFYSNVQWYNPSTCILVRTSLGPSDALDGLRETIRAIDPSLSIFQDRPVASLMALPLLPARLAAGLFGVFGALAIVLVLVGTYSVMSYGIAQRTREICIRLAIGASAIDIVRLVIRRAAIIWIAGVGLGGAAALAAAPLLAPILLGVRPRDPSIVALAMGVLTAVIAAACWLPARRGLVNDPTTLLRRT
ncbi:MAG TPA: ABC transporter permease [Vicinamibacterales bacterium]